MAKVIKFNKKRRFCRLTSCRRLLSKYNSSTYCHVHQYIALTKQVNAVSTA